ncbi:MAG: hypothetical protein AN484_22555 [Aphanizomenon flos-aquae WA102]|jgi:hypothetical protein|uniref:Uncharacterized protein n=1 Tax=Aphanizomenon flos-aquae WA102 TaxID=1710896 RepID=A0A1B7WT05_APHFL|nr:MAG: hypothetical protein AN484_22555 [Aphanizomenon flos-aquae WA102]
MTRAGIFKNNRSTLKKISKSRKQKNNGDLLLSLLLIVGLVEASLSVPFLLSSIFNDRTGSFITTAFFSMSSVAIIFWSWIQTIKNTRIKGAEEIETQLNQAINTARRDMNGINNSQDKEIKELREKIKDVDGLTSLIDVRVQELNKTYTICIKLIKIVEFIEYLDEEIEELIRIAELSSLSRNFTRRRKPDRINTSDLNW